MLRARIARVLPERNTILHETYGLPGFDQEVLFAEARAWGERLAPHITDTTALVQDTLAAGRTIILEGAQGTLLDLDHGTYPFVTSSNPVAGGACTGGGVGPLQVGEVIGVLKAYSTRVGSGPLPTELDDETGRYLLEKGHEFGTTTGRRRRCGWLDAVPLRYAVGVNSVSSIMLNKLDILSGLERLRVATSYTVGGRRVTWPLPLHDLEHARPHYTELEGWEEDISAARRMEELPPAAAAYVAAVEELAAVPITRVSVGPERSQTIVRAAAGAARPWWLDREP